MQNYTMCEVGRDFKRSSGPTCCSRRLLQPAAQDCVWRASKNLQGWRLHNPSEQPAPVLHHPQSKKSVPFCSDGTVCYMPTCDPAAINYRGTHSKLLREMNALPRQQAHLHVQISASRVESESYK